MRTVNLHGAGVIDRAKVDSCTEYQSTAHCEYSSETDLARRPCYYSQCSPLAGQAGRCYYAITTPRIPRENVWKSQKCSQIEIQSLKAIRHASDKSPCRLSSTRSWHSSSPQFALRTVACVGERTDLIKEKSTLAAWNFNSLQPFVRDHLHVLSHSIEPSGFAVSHRRGPAIFWFATGNVATSCRHYSTVCCHVRSSDRPIE